jgi:hypothetical protein
MHLLSRFRHVLISVAALALSAGLAFGAQPPAPAATGLANAAEHSGKIVPVQAAADEDTGTDEDTETAEDTNTVESAADAGDHCATDPTTATEDELAALNHGAVVCWAAHQETWPEWFDNRGGFVSCWAHSGKADAPSCIEDPNAGQPVAEATGAGHGKGQGKNTTHGKP